MREKSSANLQQRGQFGANARAWKGEDASYYAKHMWIAKHYGKASCCENPKCKSVNPKRFEWANISGEYHRDREDYKQMCPSCHRRMDIGNFCRKGHEFTLANTMVRTEGWRACRACMSDANKRYRRRQKDAID